jgi:hypothetical protein
MRILDINSSITDNYRKQYILIKKPIIVLSWFYDDEALFSHLLSKQDVKKLLASRIRYIACNWLYLVLRNIKWIVEKFV